MPAHILGEQRPNMLVAREWGPKPWDVICLSASVLTPSQDQLSLQPLIRTLTQGQAWASLYPPPCTVLPKLKSHLRNGTVAAIRPGQAAHVT